jgi:DNA-binding transcriptional LysR family regulator
VLETGSLSAAARQLGLTQPTVRAHLDGLEQSLGVVLFTRSANGLVPTDLARGLAAPTQTMARAAHAFVRTASMVPGKIGGVVRISVAEAVGMMVFPPKEFTTANFPNWRAYNPRSGEVVLGVCHGLDIVADRAGQAVADHHQPR